MGLYTSKRCNDSTVLTPVLRCSRCEDALHKNKHLISPEQRAYHKEMERNFIKLSEELQPMLHNKFGTLRGSFRKKWVQCFMSLKPSNWNYSNRQIGAPCRTRRGTNSQYRIWTRGLRNEDTLWRQHSDMIILKCWLVLPRAQCLWRALTNCVYWIQNV